MNSSPSSNLTTPTDSTAPTGSTASPLDLDPTKITFWLSNTPLSRLKERIDTYDFIKNAFDICIISETRYSSRVPVLLNLNNFGPFTIKRRFVNNSSTHTGGIALACRQNFKTKLINSSKYSFTSDHEILIFKFSLPTTNFLIFAIYLSPNTFLPFSLELLTILNQKIDEIQLTEKCDFSIIMGDLNAHSQILLGNSTTNSIGKLLETFVNENSFTVVNPGISRPTDLSDLTTGNSLDILLHNSSFPITGSMLYPVGDHVAAKFELSLAPCINKMATNSRFIRLYDKVNFKSLDIFLNQKLMNKYADINSQASAEAFIKVYNDTLIACNNKVPTLKIGSNVNSLEGPQLKKIQTSIDETIALLNNTNDEATRAALLEEKSVLIENYNALMNTFAKEDHARNTKNLNSKKKTHKYFNNLKQLSHFDNSKCSVISIYDSKGNLIDQETGCHAFSQKLSKIYNRPPSSWEFDTIESQSLREDSLVSMMSKTNSQFLSVSSYFDPLGDEHIIFDNSSYNLPKLIPPKPDDQPLVKQIFARSSQTQKLMKNNLTHQVWADHRSFWTNSCAILNEVKLSSSRRAAGPFGITNTFLKKMMLQKFFLFYTTLVWHLMLFYNFTPSFFKISKIVGIPKVDSPLNVDDYRPIGLLVIICRIFEKIFLSKFVNRLFASLSDHTLGYRNSVGVSETIMLIHARISKFKYLMKSPNIYVVSVDLRKAFDSLPLSTLITILRNCSFLTYKEKKFLIDWCQNRAFFVQSGDYRSCTTGILLAGIIQGSALSPMIFNIVINCLITELEIFQSITTLIKSFADDITITTNDPSIIPLILKAIEKWCGITGLSVNPKKSKVLSLTNAPTIDFFYKNQALKLVESLRVLGYIFNSSFDCSAHISSLKSKIAFRAKMIKNFNSKFPDVNQDVKTILTKHQIQSLTDFNGLIIGNAYRFAELYDFCIRKYQFCTIFSKLDGELDMMSIEISKQWLAVTSNLLPIRERLHVSLCGFLYKISNDSFVNRIMSDLFEFISIITIRTRSGHLKKLLILKPEFSELRNSSNFIFSNLHFYNNIYNSYEPMSLGTELPSIEYMKKTANDLMLDELIHKPPNDESWVEI